jgi:eukaryotic-like serine/threonine-protein kinase
LTARDDELDPGRGYDTSAAMTPLRHDAEGFDALPDLVTRCILEFEQGGDEAVDRLLDANPKLADEARTQLLALRDAGLLSPPTPEPLQLGPYRVLRRLGTGAVGSVYLAEQHEPMRRQVAIKVIRPGMDSREVLARFAIERQMLALLDHPNVARALDAGVTSDGRPYLCMEYVSGQPITRYCDERRLDLRQRVELMAQVCDAVHAAHQKGILHRDLKPSNILVSDRDGKPWPTVIDFGVAKSLGPRLLDVTLLTGRGRLVGTPEYMSPEQAASEIDVDTRTDVYALGVVLYELLSGHLPIASERLRRADMVQLLHMLQHETAPLPSAVVRSQATEQPQATEALAQQRRTTTTVLARDLAGELDWMVQRATETDRNRRYGMAADFAAELRRYLQHEPVLAGPYRAWYRWSKLLRRNRLQVGAIAAVLAALLAGLTASLTFYAEAASKAEQSVISLDIALAAVEHMVQVGNEDLDVVPHMEDVRRQLLAEALELQRRLAGNASGTQLHLRTARVLLAVAKVQAQLAQLEEAVAHADEAIALLAELPTSQQAQQATTHLEVSLAFAKANWIEALGHPAAQVQQLLEQASRNCERMLANKPTDEQRMLAAAIWARRGGDLGGSDPVSARRLFARAEELLKPLFDAAGSADALPPGALSVLAYHSRFCIDIGEHQEAIAIANRLQQLVSSVLQHIPDAIGRMPYCSTIEQLAAVWYRTEEFHRVANALAPAIELRRSLMKDFPSMPSHASGLGVVLVNRALAAGRLGKLDETKPDLAEAQALFERLIDEHPDVLHYHEQAARVSIHLAQHCLARSSYGLPFDVEFANSALATGQKSLDALAATESNAWLELRAETASMRGIIAQYQKQPQLAIDAQREAIQFYERLLAVQPGTVLVQSQVLDAKKLLVQNLLSIGNHEEAESILISTTPALDALTAKLGGADSIEFLRRQFLQLHIKVDTSSHRFEQVLHHIDTYLELTDDPDGDWIGRDAMAKAALQAARAATDMPTWRERLAAKVRSILKMTLSPTPASGDVSSVMVAVMRSNSLSTLVALEREFGTAKQAAAIQREIVAGYRMSFEGRPTARSHKRLLAAMQLHMELCEAAGDAEGAMACRQQIETLPPTDK